MDTSPQFPGDANGAVLRRMLNHGDDLSKPRVMDFCFIFALRKQALAFAELVDEHELEVYISYYPGRESWQAIVHRHMIPTHHDITALESDLAGRAEQVGGKADGWGSMAVKKDPARHLKNLKTSLPDPL
jgi:hypothetical protein